MSSTGRQMQQRKMLYTQPTSDDDLLSVWDSSDDWLSRAQICGRVFRKVTPALIDKIENLVARGLILKSTEPLPNGYKKFWYKRAPR